MKNEEIIQNELIKKFSYLEGCFKIQRERRIYVEVPEKNFLEILDYAVKNMNFNVLCTMTGFDEGANLAFMYHLSKENSIVLNIKFCVSKENPVIKTITSYFPAADLYEREVMDLLGAKVEGLPEGKRYPLPDDWPAGQFPLRKDWKPDFSGLKPVKNGEVK